MHGGVGGSQLTRDSVEFGGLSLWVYSKPYAGSARGGDVYYASSCATGRITRLLLAGCFWPRLRSGGDGGRSADFDAAVRQSPRSGRIREAAELAIRVLWRRPAHLPRRW